MNDEQRYYNREMSWLSFNQLVLEQIHDKTLPLFERIKFLAIYSSNIDEFYRVRVASYRSLVDIPNENKKKLDYNPEEILEKMKENIQERQQEYEDTFYNEIIPELAENGIILYQNNELKEKHKIFLKDFFLREVLPEMQPVLLSRSGNVLSFLKDNRIYLAVKMYKKNPKQDPKRPYYAAIKIPSQQLSRFVTLPKLNGKHFIFFLEDVVRYNLNVLFPGYDIESSFSIKVSRNADLQIEDEFSGNILDKLRKVLKQRKTGAPARFKYDKNIPSDLLDVLKMAFNLSENDYVKAGKYHNFNDFFGFPNPKSPKLELPPFKQLNHPILDKYSSILKAVKKHDIMLHFPYHTYDYVLRFFNEAALDPYVEEIKTTQYRVATNSAIVNALITAVRNGKKVTVFVEVKARFDEETNIRFAHKMKKAGINVNAGIPGLKVHSKTALITRKSENGSGSKRSFAFLSTGNFNEKTAKQYSDEGLFTSDKRIIKDLVKLFTYLEKPVKRFKFKHILVPLFNMNKAIVEKIQREVDNAKAGKKARLIFKMNGLEEKEKIEALYAASSAGVKIDLIVRGICCLRPGMEFSKNIQVTRIVDRYLEHSRIFAFYNDNNWEVYISSADLMTRNLRRRVEAGIPIYNKKIKREVIDLLEIQLKDNTKAKFLDKNINNIDKVRNENEELYRAQVDTYLYLQKKTLIGGY